VRPTPSKRGTKSAYRRRASVLRRHSPLAAVWRLLPSGQLHKPNDGSRRQVQLRQRSEPTGLEITVRIHLDRAGNLPINIRGRPDVENSHRPVCSEKLLEFGDRDAVSSQSRLLQESC